MTASPLIENPEFVAREHGFLFSAPMILAFLDGRKGQTRRIVAPHNSTVLGYSPRSRDGAIFWKQLRWKSDDPAAVFVDRGPHMLHGEASEYLHVPARTVDNEPVMYRVRCEHSIGDRIYAKETFAPDSIGSLGALYQACRGPNLMPRTKWKSSLFMPKKFARIWREIVGIRVQRVQDITEQDCEAEGCYAGQIGRFDFAPRPAFAMLWDDIHGQGAWKRNDWVWVYDLKEIARPNERVLARSKNE